MCTADLLERVRDDSVVGFDCPTGYAITETLPCGLLTAARSADLLPLANCGSSPWAGQRSISLLRTSTHLADSPTTCTYQIEGDTRLHHGMCSRASPLSVLTIVFAITGTCFISLTGYIHPFINSFFHKPPLPFLGSCRSCIAQAQPSKKGPEKTVKIYCAKCQEQLYKYKKV